MKIDKTTLEKIIPVDIYQGMTNYNFIVFQIPFKKENYNEIINSTDEELGKFIKEQMKKAFEKIGKLNDG